MDALVRNAFVILRMVATARYLHLKSQELHEALMEAHEMMRRRGCGCAKKVQLSRPTLSFSRTNSQPCPTSIKTPSVALTEVHDELCLS